MNSLFNFAFVKEQLKRFWAIGALSFIIYLLGCILPLLPLNFSDTDTSRFMLLIIEMQSLVLIVLNILVPLITAASLFSFMYQPNSTAALHSLPLSKRTIFASNFLTGFILIAVPLLLLCVLLAFNQVPFFDSYILDNGASVQVPLEPDLFFPSGLQTGEIINTVPTLFLFFVRTVISYMFYFCLFLFAASLAGTQVFYLLLCIILPFIPAALYLLYGTVSNIFIYGFYFDMSPFMYIFFYSSPLITAFAEELGISLTFSYVIYFLLAVLILSFSLFLFHTRKQEKAGEGLVFDKFRGVFVFFCSIAAMLLGGSFFFAIWEQIFFLYLGCIVGFMIGHIIARMLTEKTFNIFNNFYPFIRHGAALVLCFLAVIIISLTDIGGYSGRIPDESEIAGVYFGYPGYNYDDMDKRLIKEPHIISRTLSVHNALVEGKNQAYSLFSGNLAPHYMRAFRESSHIMYHLKNGGQLKRYYDIPETLSEEAGLNALLKEEEVILSDYYWLNEPRNISSITVHISEVGYADPIVEDINTNFSAYEKFSTEPPLISSAEDITSFLAAARQDFIKETRAGSLYDSDSEIYIHIAFNMKEPELEEPYTDMAPKALVQNSLTLRSGENVFKWLDNFN